MSATDLSKWFIFVPKNRHKTQRLMSTAGIIRVSEVLSKDATKGTGSKYGFNNCGLRV